MKEQQMEQQLWNYIDQLCTEDERKLIEQLLHSDPLWKAKYNELLDVHQLMQQVELEQPSMRFTKNVMEEVYRSQIAPATKQYINKNIIRGLMIFFLILIGGGVIYAFSQINWTAGSNTTVIPNPMEKINWKSILTGPYTTIFLLVNLVLGFILFDLYRDQRIRKEKMAKHL